MFIDPQKDTAEIREMKVRIPSDYYMKLHSLKLLTGTQISDAVTEALTLYFDTARLAAHAAHQVVDQHVADRHVRVS